MFSIREKMERRMVNLDNPRDTRKAALVILDGVGEATESSITMSRDGLLHLLMRAVDLGILQSLHAEGDRVRRIERSFPPERLQRGLLRVWCVALGAAGLIIIDWCDRVTSRACRPREMSDEEVFGPPTLNHLGVDASGRAILPDPSLWCIGHGAPAWIAVWLAGMLAIAVVSAGAWWVSLWVVRGFMRR